MPKLLSKDIENKILNQDRNFLLRLTEYFKYIYEEENKRRDILNNTTKIYLGAFAFVVGIGIAKIETMEKLTSMVKILSDSIPGGHYVSLLGTFLFIFSAILFFVSFVFTMLVVKMWKRERLCDPQEFVFRAMAMSNENRLLSAIIADYVVATNRNHWINEQKAKLLSQALLSLISSIIIFAITLTLFQTLNVFWR